MELLNNGRFGTSQLAIERLFSLTEISLYWPGPVGHEARSLMSFLYSDCSLQEVPLYYRFVTGFAKTDRIVTTTEIQFNV